MTSSSTVPAVPSRTASPTNDARAGLALWLADAGADLVGDETLLKTDPIADVARRRRRHGLDRPVAGPSAVAVLRHAAGNKRRGARPSAESSAEIVHRPTTRLGHVLASGAPEASPTHQLVALLPPRTRTSPRAGSQHDAPSLAAKPGRRRAQRRAGPVSLLQICYTALPRPVSSIGIPRPWPVPHAA